MKDKWSCTGVWLFCNILPDKGVNCTIGHYGGARKRLQGIKIVSREEKKKAGGILLDKKLLTGY